MAKFVMLGSYTEQGIRNVTGTIERAQKFHELVEQSGGSVDLLLWTLGEYDIVTVIDIPDVEKATTIAIKLGMLGNVRTTTVPGFTAEQIGGILAGIG